MKSRCYNEDANNDPALKKIRQCEEIFQTQNKKVKRCNLTSFNKAKLFVKNLRLEYHYILLFHSRAYLNEFSPKPDKSL